MNRRKQTQREEKRSTKGKEFVQKNGVFLDQEMIHGKGMNFLGKEFKV